MKNYTLINKFNGEKFDTIYPTYTDWGGVKGFLIVDINLKVWFISVEHSEYCGQPVVDIIKEDITEYFIVGISEGN